MTGRRVTFTVTFALLASAFTVLPAVAEGVKPPRVLAPPGDSAISQYVEVVPTDAGPTPTNPGGPSRSVLTPGQQRRLNAFGTPGRTLAVIVSQTSPDPVPPARRRPVGAPPHAAPRGSIAAVGPLVGTGGRSMLSLVLDAAAGGQSGTGIPGSAIVIAVACGGVAVVLRRRRMRQ